MDISEKEEKLRRLLSGLDAAGVPKRGRSQSIAEKTGYSPRTIAKILTGHAALTDRFIWAVCAKFGVNSSWVILNVPPVLSGVDVEGMLDKILLPPDQQKEESIKRINKLLERLSGEEFLRVEKFIIDSIIMARQ